MSVSVVPGREFLAAPRPAPEGPVEVAAAERMLGYLVFHRSLIDDRASSEDRGALLERYLALVRELKEGVHIVIDDPFQKATALLFELVLEEEFDPWEIDLVRFTQSFLERAQTDQRFDFAVSGRLVYMAWNILFLQSRELLQHRDNLRPVLPAPEGGGELPESTPELMDDGYLGELTTPESVAVTSAVLERGGALPLEEMIRHSERRPVSLLELVSAFGEAEAQARRALRIEELRERLREQQRAPPEVLVHGDVPERDLADAWTVLRRYPLGTEFPFLKLWRESEGRDRLVALFFAALFLARENVLELRQDRLAESPLHLLRTAEVRPAPAPEG
jgi:segregation and condensation protein A